MSEAAEPAVSAETATQEVLPSGAGAAAEAALSLAGALRPRDGAGDVDVEGNTGAGGEDDVEVNAGVDGDGEPDTGGDDDVKGNTDSGGGVDAAGDVDVELRAIDNALTNLVGVLDLPIEEHAERYRAVHAGLQDALSDTDSPQFA